MRELGNFYNNQMIDYSVKLYEQVLDDLLNSNKAKHNVYDFHDIWYKLTNKVDFVSSDGMAKTFLRDNNIDAFVLIGYVFEAIKNHYTDFTYEVTPKVVVNQFFYIQIDLLISKDDALENLTTYNSDVIRSVISRLQSYKK